MASNMSMTAWRNRLATSSHAGSTASARRPTYNQVCRASNLTRKNFWKGDVIAVPFHTPCTDPQVDPETDVAWSMSMQGPVYSKRRMVVILWIHERDMFCLPLFTSNKSSLRNKSERIKHEYVSVANQGKPHVNQGHYPPVEVVAMKKPLHEDSIIHLAGGVRVGCNEDITWAGRMTKDGYTAVLKLWQDLSEHAQAEPWRT
ncbi:hypothetical protein BAUCODRAFT_175025 [Baudoinia panamericana UAMH 10762]|uniref:DUF6590 domain-containing protein n=1 Tax=Baudoinia panamericana (strain UAMH 10762) TaxID=717646 RepID=M2N8W5_BAUPA|nr:uncharacterized protein BAUCODRAFT_175025 [Baudoinia panamericana UAMH 10762]EMD00589.1 hypothetical protein BAUCODRAFT_175025 [Baudoinia panamericana UAMH 10762]